MARTCRDGSVYKTTTTSAQRVATDGTAPDLRTWTNISHSESGRKPREHRTSRSPTTLDATASIANTHATAHGGTGQTRQGRRCPGRPHCLGFFLDADRRRTCCRADCRRLCPSTDDLALLEQKHVLSLSLVWELYSSLDTFCSSL